jgi:hypothetical protein
MTSATPMVPPIEARRPTRSALGTAAAAGLITFVVSLGTWVSDGAPRSGTATAAQIRSFLGAHETAVRIIGLSGALGIAAVLVFTAALARLVRQTRPGSPLADIIFGGGVLAAVEIWTVTSAHSLTVVVDDLAAVNDATLRGWYDLQKYAEFFGDIGVVPRSLVIGAFSLAALRAGLLPRWLSWLGLLIASAGLLGVVTFALPLWEPLAALWFTGLFGWWLWPLAIGVALSIRWIRTRRTPAL